MFFKINLINILILIANRLTFFIQLMVKDKDMVMILVPIHRQFKTNCLVILLLQYIKIQILFLHN